MQKPHYFENKGEFIAGTLHLPEGRRRCPGVLLLHGFTGQKAEAKYIFVELSRHLASVGIASLRFDFRGCGESQGAFENMSPLEELSDAIAALNELKSVSRVDSRRVGVVGLSMGGLVATLLAAREPSVRSLVLWSAVSRLKELVATMLPEGAMGTIEKEGRVDIGGLFMGRAFVDSLDQLDPAAELARTQAPVLVIHATADETVPYDHSDDLHAAAAARGVGVRTERLKIEGGNHVFSLASWRSRVIEATTDFLKGTLT